MNVSPLQVIGLKKAYGEFWAVQGVSFEVRAGECFGLLGPNGAGKSTSMHCITGFYPPSDGQVRILGEDVHRSPKKARLHLGVCSQDDTLDTDFSVLDQLIRFGTFFGMATQEGQKRAEHLLGRLGLLHKKNDLVERLSGGMRRKLQVARALIADPKVVVLDEPTTGLDPEARRELWEALSEVRAQGTAILLSTHYMDEAERLCDRIGILDRGTLLDCAPPQELISKYFGSELIEEEIRPGVLWKRPPNLEDVFLKLAGKKLG